MGSGDETVFTPGAGAGRFLTGGVRPSDMKRPPSLGIQVGRTGGSGAG